MHKHTVVKVRCRIILNTLEISEHLHEVKKIEIILRQIYNAYQLPLSLRYRSYLFERRKISMG